MKITAEREAEIAKRIGYIEEASKDEHFAGEACAIAYELLDALKAEREARLASVRARIEDGLNAGNLFTIERERADRLSGIVESLELFADKIMECHTGSIEGPDIEDLGLKFGLLRLLTSEEKRACSQGSNCNGCEDDDACFARADSFLKEVER